MAIQNLQNQSELNALEEISEIELNNQMLIGVCGASGVGKTVFLTSIFQSVHYHLPSATSLVIYDRDNKGGANYFAQMEEEIRSPNGPGGTIKIKLAQLHFKPSQRPKWYDKEILPVNLFDFAGGDFSNIADLKDVATSTKLSDVQKEKIFQINKYLERCDGLILLIDSKRFKPGSAQAADDNPIFQNPFPASVKYMIDSCVAKGRPLALVFTKKDLNSSLTLEKIRNFLPVKKMVLDRFTPDFNIAESGTKPFGDVHLINCFEFDPKTGSAKILDESQNIWTEDAAKIFINIVRASFTRFKERYAKEMKSQELSRNESAAKNQKEKADRFKKKMRWVMAIILLLAVLGGAFLYWNDSKRKQEIARNDQLIDTIGNNLLAIPITDAKWEKLKNIITKNSPVTPGKVDWLWQQMASILNSELSKEFMVSSDSIGTLDTCEQILEVLPSQTLNEKPEKFLDIIVKRKTVLKWWNTTVQQEIKLSGNTEQSRLSRIYQLLTTGPLQDDPQLATPVKRAFAVLMVESIMSMKENKTGRSQINENDTTRSLIEIFYPQSTSFDNIRIPYKIIYNQMGKSGINYKSYSDLFTAVSPQLTEMRNNAGSREVIIRSIASKFFPQNNPDESQQKIISDDIIATIKKNYIFDLVGMEQRVPGIIPSIEVFAAALNDKNKSKQDTFSEYFKGPIYIHELQSLLALLCQRYYQYEAINVLKKIRDSMDAGTLPLEYGKLALLEDRLKELKPLIPESPKEIFEFFNDQEKEIENIEKLIDGWNMATRDTSSNRSTKKTAIKKIKKLLKDFCSATNRMNEGDCADVE